MHRPPKDPLLLHALYPRWLDRQPVEQQAGLLLRAYRELKGLTREDVEAHPSIGRKPECMKSWENGIVPIPHDVFRASKNVLGLELNQFLELRNRRFPALFKKRWLRSQPVGARHDLLLDAYHVLNAIPETEGGLNADQFKALREDCFPALFKDGWLDDQPVEEQPGLLLRAYRELKGLTQEQLGGFLDVSQGAIKGWEANHGLILGDKFPLLKIHLGLNTEQFLDFRNRRFLALNPEWLATEQSVEKRGGLLLRAYLDLAGLSTAEVGRKIGVGQSTVSHWATGRDPIPRRNMSGLCRLLRTASNKLDEPDRWFDEQLFKETAEASNEAIHAHKLTARQDTGHARRLCEPKAAGPGRG